VKIAVLTCYDASFAAMLDAPGLDSLLIGDSLAWCCRDTTPRCGDARHNGLPHAVRRARSKRSFLVADMPFAVTGITQQAFRSAAS